MEAEGLFRRQNTFIRLNMPPTEYHQVYPDIDDGLAIVAYGDRTRHFPDTAMTLTFDFTFNEPPESAAPRCMSQGPPTRYTRSWIIHVTDLETLCANLLRFFHRDEDQRIFGTSQPISGTRLQVSIDTKIGHSTSWPAQTDVSSKDSISTRLLEPLRRLHSLDDVEIIGLDSVPYR